ncbi:hypothetical protein AB4156_31010 [Cupriavidus sp. 2MCAB6]|uniref:hypothetical protein n=1 Tax=Cupriavidus sp. 2MCAB6 TaxID=3232981 RepID=UPI003F93AF88
MKITGRMLIGQEGVSGTTRAFNAFSPAACRGHRTRVGAAPPDDADRACRLAVS